MSKMIGEIRSANDDFYSDESLLKSSAYVETLGPGNIIVGIVYILFSTGAAILLHRSVRIYQFMQQASYEDIGDMEVRAWAVRQAENSFVDPALLFILALSVVMLVTVCIASFGIKKYQLYKHQDLLLLLLCFLALAQIAVTPALSFFFPAGGLPSVPAAICEAGGLLFVFLPQLFAGKLFYPLEFKNLSGLIKFLNMLAEAAVGRLK